MKKLLTLSILFVILSAGTGFSAEEINENEMFSNTNVITQEANTTPQAEEKKSIGFSGELTSVTEDIGISTSTKDFLNSYILSNIFLDVRMKNDIKAFANLETNYQPKSRTTEFNLRELFFDFNFDRHVYLRTGKQVLHWGRCYLWNPTDLINIEKKPFIRKIGYREGAYGMKLHVPFGTKYNIYGFLDTGNAPSPENLGGALKYEFLTGKTEMAFSGWAKKTYNPVFGYDFSSRISDIDILGEFSISKGDNVNRIRENQGTLEIFRNNKDWAPRSSINFSKGFRIGNFNDRLTVSTEFFYNQPGYKENIFKDNNIYQFSAPTILSSGTKMEFLLLNNLYDPNYLSRYYSAIFTTLSRFVISDMNLNMNYILNIDDGSGILSTGVTYKNINDLSAGFLVNTFLGEENGEYTFSNLKYDLQLTAGISF
ncbi:MAG: hypothetical protein A2539_02990 [Elusimicrobia bacterium RIFOXYD2_FULL_34_15]|nr:MAG: hypothetical protein A2539_02990 [Elusimicrobia bacterium RIFOXYD2_FULL_34_15]